MTGIKKEMKKFYSSSRKYMKQLKSHGLSEYGKYVEKIIENAPPKSRVLDVGCGVGQVSNYLAEKGFEATGIDISPLFVKEARKNGKAKFISADTTKLPFEDESFDAVISAETLEHIPEPEKALSEMARVLKKKGIIALRFPNRHSKIENFVTLLVRKPLFKIVNPKLDKNVAGDDEDLCYVASSSDVIVFLKARGFKIIYSKPFFWPSALIIARKA